VNANWYDLLDVDPDATSDEIRAAWRSAIEGMDPTDRRFRVYNRAAEVLLDEDKRAAYDVELAAQESEAEAESTEAEPDEAEPDEALPDEAEPDEAEPDEADPAEVVPDEAEALVVLAKDADDEAADAADEDSAAAADSVRRPVPAWLLLSTTLVTALVVAGAVALWWFKPSDQAVADATEQAEQAAQRATPVLFSYDYTRLDADHDAAVGYLTSDYRKSYEPLFAVIKQNAPDLQVKLHVDLVASGIVRTGDGREADDRVQVFVMFNQVKTDKASASPTTYPAFATLSMEKVDGEWLVDGVEGPPVLK
jgi:Mce-associated membrane protein